MSSTSSSSTSSSSSSPTAVPATAFGVEDEEAAMGKRPRPVAPRGLHPALHICNWIFFSNLTILFNKWILDSAGFRYPILLTCWHLVFATLATQLLARTTTLLDSRHKLPITPRLYLRTICPIGLLYSGSLVCSNLVYLYLSVAFIQMLKSAAPVAVLFTSWAWRVADPSLAALLNILVIVAGVALASFGEIQFSMVGFLYQIGGIAFEAVRVVMIQVMLSGEGLKMDPLVGLYYYAPVCAVMNVLVALPSEVPRFQWEDLTHVGFGMLFLNAGVAFLLNIASVFLIGKTSGLVMTLTGIFKNILLIIVSIIIWRTEITLLQGVGYSIALAGLTYYSVGYDQLARGASVAIAWSAGALGPASTRGRSASALNTRRLFLVAGFAICGLFIVITALRHYDPKARTPFSMPAFFGTE
ncbi:Putative sugar phosphate/phosphate translocator [Tolypocladium paradoxum]|uniref:Sugar phosphate/phosphate translocator n=1 Tax=Tolypocladium paradoxum TaxID=94208 RepID=A0A2S4L2V8_9HYPO|nr:Putative sugar phosphate/phosphate translocator [Tolypocladium paradoxum]